MSTKNYEVRITEDMKFDSPDIEVCVGDTVTWVNADSAAHTVTTVQNHTRVSYIQMPEVGLPAGTFSDRVVFDTAGTFNYQCRFHPHMTGKVCVS